MLLEPHLHPKDEGNVKLRLPPSLNILKLPRYYGGNYILYATLYMPYIQYLLTRVNSGLFLLFQLSFYISLSANKLVIPFSPKKCGIHISNL